MAGSTEGAAGGRQGQRGAALTDRAALRLCEVGGFHQERGVGENQAGADPLAGRQVHHQADVDATGSPDWLRTLIQLWLG